MSSIWTTPVCIMSECLQEWLGWITTQSLYSFIEWCHTRNTWRRLMSNITTGRMSKLVQLVAGYCCPVWSWSSYSSFINSELNNVMRLIIGYVQPIWVPCLSVLANIMLPGLHCKTTANLLPSTVKDQLPFMCWYIWSSLLGGERTRRWHLLSASSW